MIAGKAKSISEMTREELDAYQASVISVADPLLDAQNAIRKVDFLTARDADNLLGLCDLIKSRVHDTPKEGA